MHVGQCCRWMCSSLLGAPKRLAANERASELRVQSSEVHCRKSRTREAAALCEGRNLWKPNNLL